MDDQEPPPDEVPLADTPCLYSPGCITFTPLPEKDAARMATHISAIREMYTAGVPIYCKETLASVSGQMEAVKDGRRTTIDVKAMNNETVEFNVETGLVVWPTDQPNLEYILVEPEVGFQTYQQLTSTKFNFMPHLAFSALRIDHLCAWRDHITKEPLRPSTPTSLIDTRNQYLETYRLWRESVACKEVEWILKQRIPPQTDTVVAFALGSISKYRDARRSLFQHALAHTVHDVVSNQCQRARCYSQDPIYNAVDKEVLREVGINVLENPQAFLEVSNSSVVISCAPDIPVKQIVADLARPAVLIWSPVRGKTHISGFLGTDQESPRVERLIRDYYEEFTFQGDVDLFGHLTVSVRIADRLG